MLHNYKFSYTNFLQPNKVFAG